MEAPLRLPRRCAQPDQRPVSCLGCGLHPSLPPIASHLFWPHLGPAYTCPVPQPASKVYSSGKDLLFPFAKRLIRDFKEHRDDDTMWGPMAQDCIEITFYFAALIPGALRRQSRHLRSSETEERGRKREDEAASELNSVSCVRVGSREWPDALEAAVELKALTGGRCCLHVPGASGAVRRVGSLPGKDFLYDQVLKARSRPSPRLPGRMSASATASRLMFRCSLPRAVSQLLRGRS